MVKRAPWITAPVDQKMPVASLISPSNTDTHRLASNPAGTSITSPLFRAVEGDRGLWLGYEATLSVRIAGPPRIRRRQGASQVSWVQKP
jgi:hypothetical protein